MGGLYVFRKNEKTQTQSLFLRIARSNQSGEPISDAEFKRASRLLQARFSEISFVYYEKYARILHEAFFLKMQATKMPHAVTTDNSVAVATRTAIGKAYSHVILEFPRRIAQLAGATGAEALALESEARAILLHTRVELMDSKKYEEKYTTKSAGVFLEGTAGKMHLIVLKDTGDSLTMYSSLAHEATHALTYHLTNRASRVLFEGIGEFGSSMLLAFDIGIDPRNFDPSSLWQRVSPFTDVYGNILVSEKYLVFLATFYSCMFKDALLRTDFMYTNNALAARGYASITEVFPIGWQTNALYESTDELRKEINARLFHARRPRRIVQ